jgi:predicted DNA-binding transcriptional regulator AlpA
MKIEHSIQRERPGPGDGNAGPLIAVSKLLTAVEVAELTGLSTETLAQWRSQRRGIPYVKISHNCVRYRQIDLDQWVGEHIVRVTAVQIMHNLAHLDIVSH